MPGNTFGTLLRVTTFGESHGAALGAVIDGCPSRIRLTEADIQHELDRRRPGQSAITTPRSEADRVKILSGVFEGKTLGSPIALIVENADQRSDDYANLKNRHRPGHADFAWDLKFGFRDHRGGGRSSGRETVGRVMGGAIAKKILREWIVDVRYAKKPVEIFAFAQQIGTVVGTKIDRRFIEKNPVRAADREKAATMEALILKAKKAGDSLGGVVKAIVKNMPGGLGEPVFDKLNADLAKALFSIPAVKAVEFCVGKEAAILKGSEHNAISGIGGRGLSGGISTGEDLFITITVKPPSSIIRGRHDPCIVPRFIPVAESMIALTLADHVLRYRAIKT